jgi:phage tail sheath gpL-like
MATAVCAGGGGVTTGAATEADGDEEEAGLSDAWPPNSVSRNRIAASAAVAAATSHNHLPARPVQAGLMSSSCGLAIARGREDAEVGRPEERLAWLSARTFGNGSRMMRVAPDCPAWA